MHKIQFDLEKKVLDTQTFCRRAIAVTAKGPKRLDMEVFATKKKDK